MHSEVIKKSYYLLEFMYNQGKLGSKELGKMWHVATKKHEAFKAAIFKALTFLASKMAPKELEFLFEKLRAMPNKDHDKLTLGLLKAIAKKLAPAAKLSKLARVFGQRTRGGAEISGLPASTAAGLGLASALIGEDMGRGGRSGSADGGRGAKDDLGKKGRDRKFDMFNDDTVLVSKDNKDRHEELQAPRKQRSASTGR